MAKPWEELHTQISTDKELQEAVAYKGLTCLEIHAGWCGPCTAVVPTLKKLHWDLVEERSAAVQFVVCNSDNVEAFKEYRDRSKPLFMIYRKGNKLTVIEGVNTSALKSYIEDNAPSKADVASED
mmetsp:Transcript_1152/g.2479  ORF Transcript_1152/g.2479 Transcript_1152/m.2479 type:complete len:125 (-) Transcript_1152:144-518(-)|eukprot:CAMPEP_0172182948 /NCGR_PEP_ID=MMETSP1050-20130122/18697_1 /TAXON_ID=233186 /ORGANISM="Cryptomonas curvata, Strain CCAP979/52" /LENGTH=124 /DNA_ID=CAMNT_0012856479 /DNA_START=17 /DNA_END=391 /DNA_ORIENTATION=+